MLLQVAFLALAPTPLPEGYVDDARCARCHADITATFAGHGMGRSFWVPGPGNAIEDFSEEGGHYHHPSSGQHYRMRLDDQGRMWMKQYEVDSTGQPINEVEIEAHFAVGSGNHARTYLYRSPSGELWELPVTWYTGTGWRMSPGYDHANHQRLGRQVARDCIFCHTAYPGLPDGEDRIGRLITFPEVLPLGIGCQRCHGPGEAHVDLAYSATATDKEIAASILDPSDLPPALADDLCLQCHMQPSSRLGSLVRPFDRGVFSYRPGEALETYLAHVDFPPREPSDTELEINHHAYQMDRSLCVQQGGRISCLDCHDPHHKLSPAGIQARTLATCLGCHAPEACRVEQVMQIPIAEAQDCATCHMPHRVPRDVIHSAITDHRIQNPSTEGSPPTTDGPPPAFETARLLQADRFRNDPRADTYPILGEMLSNRTDRVYELATRLEGDHSVSPRLLLAQGFRTAGDDNQERSVLESLVRDAPWATTARINLAALNLEAGDIDSAREQLEQLLEEEPNVANGWSSLATVHSMQGRTQEALAAARRAVELRPLEASSQARLGTYLATEGDFTLAAESFGRAEALSPGDPSVGYNLGLSHWKAGNRSRADRAWRHALARSPNSPRLLRVTILARTLPWPGLEPDHEGALLDAASFYRANPSSADATLLLAIAMLANERAADLGPVLQQAAQLNADAGAIRLLEAMSLAETGREAEGRVIYQRVAPRLKQLDMLREGLLRRASQTFGQAKP